MPLYLSWIALSSGCMSCMPRLARIWRTNSGMMRRRITIVSPTIDSTQAAPGPLPMPMRTRKSWMRTMTQATATLSGQRIVSIALLAVGIGVGGRRLPEGPGPGASSVRASV